MHFSKLKTITSCLVMTLCLSLIVPHVMAAPGDVGSASSTASKTQVPLLSRVVKKLALASITLLLTGHEVPTEASYGLTLSCSSVTLGRGGGATNPFCSQWGSADHGVICKSSALATLPNGENDWICSTAISPDENFLRKCTNPQVLTLSDGTWNIACTEYNLRADGQTGNGPYCNGKAYDKSTGVGGVICSNLYCPTCYYKTCFPEETWVDVYENETLVRKSIRDLRPDDLALSNYKKDGSPVFSPIVRLNHREPDQVEAYVLLTYRDLDGSNEHSVFVSGNHLMFATQDVDADFTTSSDTKAEDLKQGDYLWTKAHGKVRLASNPRTHQKKGVYAPHTESGTLVTYGSQNSTSGVVASVYSDVASHLFAHTFFQARRALLSPQELNDTSVVTASDTENAALSYLRYWAPSIVGERKLPQLVGHHGNFAPGGSIIEIDRGSQREITEEGFTPDYDDTANATLSTQSK